MNVDTFTRQLSQMSADDIATVMALLKAKKNHDEIGLNWIVSRIPNAQWKRIDKLIQTSTESGEAD